jgi:hypothetical protein
MTSNKEWFCKYERYDGGDFFLGDELIAKIIGRGKFYLNLMYERIRKLHGVIHILRLAKILIF